MEDRLTEFGWEKVLIIVMVTGMIIGGTIAYCWFDIYDWQSVLVLAVAAGAILNAAVFSGSLLVCSSEYTA
jgi:hypothetical protein